MDPFRFHAGDTPLLVSIPHAGTYVPPEIVARLSPAARPLPDTDWHVDRLYDFLEEIGANVLCATHSRYVIDLNRPPDDTPLYPGADNTGLCPTTTFDEAPVYRNGAEPDGAEIAARREHIWRPYHDRLQAELGALIARHGIALLWDAHSIRSRVPRFFDGCLPDLNFGTGGGTSADPELPRRLAAVAAKASGYSHVVDGRFKGGFITRAYGDPANDVHAIQLELSQITYMDEAAPYGFREDLAAALRPVLRGLLRTGLDWTQA
ncbi:MAG TPA: N-formylglutamate deformylase, partial [Kiloniellales bacterium]